MPQTNQLVIVESSTKASVIEKYLNSSSELAHKNARFKVVASQGHFRDMSKKNMGVNTDTFESDFVLIDAKKKIVSNLKKMISSQDFIYIATDNDREGEGIAWHLKEYFKIPSSKYTRILFNEITKKAIVHAVLNPTKINQPMVNSYLSRRILDRLVGFMITKLLWKAFDSNVVLTAGRVQSVALRLIIQKETDINQFVTSPYWVFQGNFGTNLSSTQLYYKTTLHKVFNEKEVVHMLTLFKTSTFLLHKAELKVKQESPPLPFTTSSLQQSAYSSVGMSIKKTMSVAQELYEMGAITYMRTDSTTISEPFEKAALQYVTQTFGDTYAKNYTNTKKNAAKNAQEAHEAIRPTALQASFPQIKTKDQKELYSLIFKRTVAYFMSKAIFHEANISITCNQLPKDYMFVGKENVLFFDGWLKLYDKPMAKVTGQALIDKYAQSTATMNPVSFIGDCIWSSPPSRYNESTLVNVLEKKGIGRPSTYASIISKLFDKNYVEKANIEGVKKSSVDYMLNVKKQKITKQEEERIVGEEKSRIRPTTIGLTVDSFVHKEFPQIVDTNFTSNMESALDEIAKGSLHYVSFLKQFYAQFKNTFDQVASTYNSKTASSSSTGKMAIKEPKYTVTVDETQYTMRRAKYGEVIEYNSVSDNKVKYIDLKPYLKDTKKTLDKVDKTDIKLLTSLPKKLNDEYTLKYGKYGFYLYNAQQDSNQRVFANKVQWIAEKNWKKLIEMAEAYDRKK